MITKLTFYNEPLEMLCEKSKNEYLFLRKAKQMLIIIEIKITIFLCLVIIIEISIIYYLFVFCSVYKSSQWNWFYNSILSIGISLLTSLVITFIISVTRYLGFWLKSETIYNLSLYINRE